MYMLYVPNGYLRSFEVVIWRRTRRIILARGTVNRTNMLIQTRDVM